MQTITSNEMKLLDKKATEHYKIPSLLLMENAGRGVAEFVFHLVRPGRVTVFCGQGNNGGDGFVISRHLHNRGFKVLVIFLGTPSKLKPDAGVNYAILQAMKIPVVTVEQESQDTDFEQYVDKSDIVIDCLFGIGLSKPILGIYALAIQAMNAKAKALVAVDIPSGLHADTGEVLGIAVKATHTATLAAPKKGLLMGSGPECAGKICVVDIGIPREELIRFQS